MEGVHRTAWLKPCASRELVTRSTTASPGQAEWKGQKGVAEVLLGDGELTETSVGFRTWTDLCKHPGRRQTDSNELTGHISFMHHMPPCAHTKIRRLPFRAPVPTLVTLWLSITSDMSSERVCNLCTVDCDSASSDYCLVITGSTESNDDIWWPNIRLIAVDMAASRCVH